MEENKIYLKKTERLKRDSLYSFLKRCIDKTSDFKYKSYGRFPASFKDENCYIPEKGEAYRSFDAIVEISKTYFKVSDKRVAKTLKRIMTENKGKQGRELGFLFCGTANRWTMHENSGFCWYLNQEFILNYSSSLDAKHVKGSGKYCMNDIIFLMNS